MNGFHFVKCTRYKRAQVRFLNNQSDLLDFIRKQSDQDQVEVAALVLKNKKTGGIEYFVEPWSGNAKDESKNNLGWVPNYQDYHVIAQLHTHFSDWGPGPADSQFSTSFQIPVYVIGPTNIWKANMWLRGQMVPRGVNCCQGTIIGNTNNLNIVLPSFKD